MKSKSHRAVVVGGTGYGGGEIIRRLLTHPHVELAKVTSVDLVGMPLAAAHPNLEGLSPLCFEAFDPETVLDGVDVAFFALPHEASATLIPGLLSSSKAKIIDMSGAFRTESAEAYERWYGTEHPHPEVLSSFVYGLPELRRNEIADARCVASPGCFATAIQLSLLPLARRGWLEGRVEVVGMTGSSGSGAQPNPGTHHPTRSVNLRAYRPLTHPQTPEIVETLQAAGSPELQISFVPISAPLSRGILSTAFVRRPEGVEDADISRAYRDDFEGCPMVRVPDRRLPEVAAVAGSAFAEVGVDLTGPSDGPFTCFGALDNLIKGGAGQAVQNMNLMLGFDEQTGLSDPGSWP